MNIKYFFFLIILVSPLTVAKGSNHDFFSGGRMQFQGLLITSTCRVSIGDSQMKIHLDKKIDVYLNECTELQYKNIELNNSGVFKKINNDIQDKNNMSNIKINIFDKDKIIINSKLPKMTSYIEREVFHSSIFTNEDKKPTRLPFAQAWFSITYQ